MKNFNKSHPVAARVAAILAILAIALVIAVPFGKVILNAGYAATNAYKANQERITNAMDLTTTPQLQTETTETNLSEEYQAAIMAYEPGSVLMIDASRSVSGNYYTPGTVRYATQFDFTDHVGQTGGDSAIGTNIKVILDAGCRDLGVITDCHSEPASELEALRGSWYENIRVTIFYTSNTDHDDLDKLVEILTSVMDSESCSLLIVAPDGEMLHTHDAYKELSEVLEGIHTTVITTTETPAVIQTEVSEVEWQSLYMETLRPYAPVIIMGLILMGFGLIAIKRMFELGVLADEECSCDGTDGDTGCKCCKCCCKCTCCEDCFFKRFCRKCRCCSGTCAASAPRVESAASVVPPAYTAPATATHRYEYHYYTHDGEATRRAEDASCAALVVDGVHSIVDRSRYSEAVCELADDASHIYLFDNEDCTELETITDINSYPCVTDSDFNRMLCEMHARGYRHLNLVTRNLSDIGELYSYMTFDSINLWVPGDVEIHPEELEKLNALLTGGNTCQVYYMEESE